MHGHIHSFSCYSQLLTSPRRYSLPPSSHQSFGNIQRLFINNPKIFEDLFVCKIVLVANHQQPGNIQRLSGQQSAAAINSSKQQQQSAAVISSSNQQQPAATSRSNQQQQSAAAISSSNQHQRPSTAISIHPTSSTYTIHDDFR